MASVDMGLLKQLREATFAPLKDCREALIESNGNIEEAEEALRKKGIMKAWARAERETKEWITRFVEKDGWIWWIKLLCETDFVAKNEDFAKLADDVLNKLFTTQKVVKSLEDLDPALLAEMTDMVAAFVGKIWENIKLETLILDNSKWYVYNHPGNRVATIIYYEWDNWDVAKEIALQVTAMNPQYFSFDDVPADFKEKLMTEFRAEMEGSNKPADMIEGIIEWKFKKAVWESVLLEQEYIRDWSKKIKDIIPADVKFTWYIRLGI